MDPIDTLLQVVSIQSTKNDDSIGLNVNSKLPEDMMQCEVVEPARVIEQAISGASEVSVAVLRIDDVLWARQEISVPEDVQASLDGTAPDRR
jgi:chaperonin GroEL (HSP60 family)